MLDFSKLRSQIDGQRGGFEELVCQLGRINPPSDGIEFRRIEGSGGDGGIEAYWVDKDDREYGYQAKFHTKPKDIDWTALDKSVSAAILSHPRLVSVKVAFACDLTDTVVGRKGKSGRAHWNTHKTKWQSAAFSRGQAISFTLWGASEIEQLLTYPLAVGLREYWFSQIELNDAWFQKRFDQTVAALEDRFAPEDHVNTAVQRVFKGFRRDADWKAELKCKLLAIEEEKNSASLNEVPADFSASIDTVFRLTTELDVAANSAQLDLDRDLPTGEWLHICRELHTKIQQFRMLIRDIASDSPLFYKFKKVDGLIGKIAQTAHWFENFLNSPVHQADVTRFGIFEGTAGAGKSHLLASEVARTLSSASPAIMLLGTDFSETLPIAEQLPARLGLPVAIDTFLGALEAAALAKNTRALLVIDAINEGGGSRWLRDLNSLAIKIKGHRRLAFVVSCRSEYSRYLVSEVTRSIAVLVTVRGFVSPREQEEAAQKYMDRRGIRRPATPWLSPEFTSPLFLRATCLSLARDGQTQYPLGLRGVREVLAFYLNAVGRHLDSRYDGSNDLVSPLKRAVVGLAAVMASNRKDHVPRGQGTRVVDAEFEGLPAGDRSWLDRLRLNGIIRIDPDHDDCSNDPLSAPREVVRFAFQRFQDHLVAKQLLEEIVDVNTVFAPQGALRFLLDKDRVVYPWIGVFQALWTLIAEVHRAELVDLLPQPSSRWWSDYEVQRAFVESVFWRSNTAFTDRSCVLLNSLDDYSIENVLLPLSVHDHPWNAEFIDSNLKKLRLADRDATWTVRLNGLVHEDHPSAATRLVDWCFCGAIEYAGTDTLSLALVTLGWLLASTNRQLRDRATKAAVEILLVHPELLPPFVVRFAHVDDLYVLERVLAACAGACFRDPVPNRLRCAASVVYEEIFSLNRAPIHILARDYARSIIELANDHNALSEGVRLELCRPPFRSAVPRLPKDTSSLKKLAAKVGDHSIVDSCTGFVGDFGRYVVEGRVRDFSNVRLTENAPSKAVHQNFSRGPKKRLDQEGAKRWIAGRAIKFGWTHRRFPDDYAQEDERVRGARTERVGKKYQWIAYYELLAMLTDNYWLIDEYSETYARVFDNPINTEFTRDIDPTVPAQDVLERKDNVGNKTIPKHLAVEEVATEAQKAWVFHPKLAEDRLHLGLCEDLREQEDWFALYRYASAQVRWPQIIRGLGHQVRQDDFHFVSMIAVQSGKHADFIHKMKARRVDFHRAICRRRR